MFMNFLFLTLKSIKSTIDTHLNCLSKRMAPLQLDDSHLTAFAVAGPLIYKNKLQEFAQKSGLPLPIYQNVNEGFQHAPKFRSIVFVDNTKYTSQNTFPDRKAAEQEAARLAYESISKNAKKEDFSSVYQFSSTLNFLGFLSFKNPILCKSILHEYAIKMNMSIPKYHTTYAEGPRPVFISSFVFGGKTYTGEVAQSKKVAEQLVARKAIRSILGLGSGTLAQIIKSKDNLYTSLHGNKSSGNDAILNLAVQQDQPREEDRTQITGLPSEHQKASVVSFGARPGRTTNASMAKRKIETNSWEQRKKRST